MTHIKAKLEKSPEKSAGEVMRASVLHHKDTPDRVTELKEWVEEAKTLGKKHEKEPKEPDEKEIENEDDAKETGKKKFKSPAEIKKELERRKADHEKNKEIHAKAQKDREDILVEAHSLTGDLIGKVKMDIDAMEAKKEAHTKADLENVKKNLAELHKINDTILAERGTFSVGKTATEGRARFGRAEYWQQMALVGGLTAAVTWGLAKGKSAWKWVVGTTVASLAALHLWRGAREERLKKDLEHKPAEQKPGEKPAEKTPGEPAKPSPEPKTMVKADKGPETELTLAA